MKTRIFFFGEIKISSSTCSNRHKKMTTHVIQQPGIQSTCMSQILNLANEAVDMFIGIPYPAIQFDPVIAPLFAGNDTIIGSKKGYSLLAWMHDGNDYLELHSGFNNIVNTNMGDDTINLYSSLSEAQPGGQVSAGKGRDTINIYGGWFDEEQGEFVNGNNDSDVISNWGEYVGLVRGGKDNDLIINYKGMMDVYGDKGADTFVPYYDHSWEQSTWMEIKDFQIGYDILDTSRLGSGVTQSIDGDGLNIFADGPYGNQLVATLEGIYQYI